MISPRHDQANVAVPLSSVPCGRRVRVISIDGGQSLRGRLCALGLTPGTPVQVVCDGGGPVVLEVLGSRLIVGRGMASQVLVRPV